MPENVRCLLFLSFILLFVYGIPSPNSILHPYSPLGSFSDPIKDLSAPVCNKYKCQESSQDYNSCSYFEQDESTFYVKPCSDPSYSCSVLIDKLNYTCQLKTPTPTSFPGDKCSSIDDCYGGYSQSCTNGICIGRKIGDACTSSYQCSPNSTCREINGNLQCAPLLEIGETGCSQEFDCVYNAGCNFTSSSNVCVAYGSLSPGTEILVKTCNLSENLCSSHTCLQRAAGDETAVCTGEVSSNAQIPIACNSPQTYTNQCISKLDNYTNWETSSVCSCGYNSDGNAYCDLLPGDAPMQAYYRELKKWQESSAIKNCNTIWRYPMYNGLNLQCAENNYEKSSYESFFYWFLYTTLYVEVYEAEDCVLKTFYPVYYSMKNSNGGDNDDSAREIALASLLLLFSN
ncbi:unnamed protein product [Blepharisma stoltei]|uniref:Dickkopf N-terminal cysteine-rich domain-containing protein n=1 Tax=Blepharisma stoltei TaxID=1481888 RepID=A0AAU9ICK0_9CILI|nr:unnamed protein product [Blepharisma stoltei]